MSFNLKNFMKKASADLNTTTEGQLGNDGSGPSELQEGQLEFSRGKETTSLPEKQLDAVRTDKSPAETTEAQIGSKGKAPNATSEKQLAGNQVGGSTDPIEKRLDGVRQSTFNAKAYFTKMAAKPAEQTTEGQFGKRKDNAPTSLTETQMDSGREDVKPVTTQALLEKARTGEAQKLTEAQMDDSKSKLVKHRNASTAKGDINKLEEQRIASKKAQEKEEYEVASRTDKKLMFPEVKGKDGLRTAKSTVGITKQAGGWDGEYPISMLENETPGWDETDPFVSVRPDLDSIGRSKRKTKRNMQDEALITDLTRDVEVPDDDELAALDPADLTDEQDVPETGDQLLPDEEDGGKLDLPETFVEESVNDVDVGVTKMRQVVLSFDPENFDDEDQVKKDATGYMFAKHSGLFHYVGGREDEGLKIEDSMTVSMDEGRVTVTLPSDAFQSKASEEVPEAMPEDAPTSPQAA